MADTVEGLTVIFPMAPSATNLADSLSPWLGVLNNTGRPYEVLLVADGITDDLRAIIEKITSKHPRVKLLALEKPTGFGACIRLGIAEASQPLVFYSALGGGWNPADLPRMLKSIGFKDEYTGRVVELVNGHRRGLPEPSGRKRRRRVFGFLFRVLYGMWPEPHKGYLGRAESRYWYRARLQFGLRIGDPNSRFKLFHRRVLERIVIQSDGEFVHTELLAKANFLDTMMDEIVLADKCVPGELPDMSEDRKKVFSNPKFTTPTTTQAAPPASPEMTTA
ncbi:glycosyltransferase [Zavarzinella formosa]|uniref:glycosyltransferase n=1 Tax=Zavarzinella formosa TaxID=360055 RepID=UPI00030BBAF7|nr:glycosyltransferase [Zavarzinella formosa]